MRKQHVLFAALAAAVALSASGCRSREKIDLDTLHTSEAETMASTETSGGDKEKETEKAEEKETEKEAGKETGETQKGADSSSALSVRSKIATEKQGKTSIEYAVLSNLRDPKMEETVNALIKEKALQILTDYQIDPAADTLTVKCTVLSLDKNKAVLTYEGSLMVNGAAHPSDLFYTTTVDLNKGTLLGLSDYADAYTMAGYILSDDCVLKKPADAKEALEYLKSQDLNAMWDILKQCDFTAENTEGFPQSFSYENQGIIYMAVPVPHALGDYVIVSYTPDTK
ncbi:MAG: DUF4163 domain-containing protein [Sakamotonia sp.]